MREILTIGTTELGLMSQKDLLNYKNDLLNRIFEIGTPLNVNEILLFENLYLQFDFVDALLLR